MDSIQREKKKSPGKRKVRRGSGISCEETRGEPPLLFEEQRNDRRPRVGKIPMRSAASIRYKGNQVARAYLHGRGVAIDEFKAELHCGLDDEVVVFGHAGAGWFGPWSWVLPHSPDSPARRNASQLGTGDVDLEKTSRNGGRCRD